MLVRFFLVILVLLNSGCSLFNTPAPPSDNSIKPLNTLYDYQLLSPNYQPLAFSNMVDLLQDADVVFIGEYHRNQASHLLEMQVFAALHQISPERQQILSLEMFTRDQQALLDRYLKSEVGERYLMKEAPAWPNYQSSYRPLVEYAKQHDMPVIAANAPGDTVRCIGRKGSDYLPKLTETEKAHIAAQPFAEIPAYEDKFFGLMSGSGHMPDSQKARMRNSYLAQITRDNTMAESIVNALNAAPGSRVVHLNGSFHSEGHLGTVAALKRLNPALKVKVITPVHIDQWETLQQEEQAGNDDVYYLLNAQPQEFVDEAYQRSSRKAMFDKSREKAKACL